MSKKKPEAPPVQEEQKEWTFTQEDINKTTDIEVAWGTTRCLPPEKEIPKEFWEGNVYSRVVDSMFVGEAPASAELTLNTGFESCMGDFKGFNKFIIAHLRSFQPKHQHKIAGIAYMISKIMTINPDKE